MADKVGRLRDSISSLLFLCAFLCCCESQVTPTLPQNTQACMGNDVDINCVYSFSVGLTVNWIIDGVDFLPTQLTSSPLYNVSTMYNMDTQMGSSTLTILAINITTTVQCQAALDPPVNSEVGRVVVAGLPSPVETITRVDEVCSVNFIISWNAVNSSSACGTVLYNVTILPDDDGVMMMRITDTSYNIIGVTPNTRYDVTVSSRNDAGMGQSNMIIVTTPNMTNDPIGPPFPNGMITVVDLCLVDFALSWNPFSSNPVCGSVSYDVMILPSDGVMMMRITDTSYNFTRVLPDTAYTVTVTGINDDGMGLQSMMIINPRNRTSVLPDLSELSNTTTTHNTVVVKWNLTNVPGCGDVSLTVRIHPRHGSGGMIVNNMATFSDLENGTTYTITVTATNRVGNMEQTIRITTLGDRPTDGGSDSSSTGAIVGGVVGGIVAVVVIIVIIVMVYIFVIRPKGENSSDTTALKMSSPTGTSTGGRVAPSSNLQSGPTEVYADVQKPVPHKTAATGEEYAVSTKATKPGKGKPQGPTEEYAQIDKSKKSGQQGIQYADLADLPQSTSDPSAKGPTSMYAQVA